MPDATYQNGVYMKQGGDELVVADSGLITVEAGGYIAMPSSAEAEGTTMQAYGVSTITGSSSDLYELAVPAGGEQKTIFIDGLTTGITVRVYCASAYFDETTSNYLFAGSTASTGDRQVVQLVAENSTNWHTFSRSTGISITTG